MTIIPAGIGPNTSHRTARKSGGLPISISVSGGGETVSWDMYIPSDERRHEHDESGDRAGDADVEQNLACRERLADSDDGAERADLEADGTEIERQKVRQRRVELVAPARQVVAHLVRAQDGQNRRAVPEAVDKRAPLGHVHAHPAKVRQEREIAVLADQRGGDERDEEERDVFPPDVLEAPAWLGREHDWRVRNGRRGADHVGVRTPDRRPDNGDRVGVSFDKMPGVRRRSAADVLKVLARLEPDRSSRRNPYFLARPRVAADSALAGLHLKDAKASQFDSFAALHRQSHRIEDGVHRHLGLDLGDVGDLGHLVDDVNLDHA